MPKNNVVGRIVLIQELQPNEPTGMTKEKDHESEEEKESEKEIRDLPPKKDVKGGNGNGNTRGPGRTGEVDFMQDFD